jgi:dolichol-phosphate mannosyltransferase
MSTRIRFDGTPAVHCRAVGRDDTSGSTPNVWICVPTFNEATNLPVVTSKILGVLEASAIDGHVLVVDDNSPDGTGRIADELASRDPRVSVLHRPEREGIGPAYRAAFRYVLARGADLIIQMDCDLSHDPSAVPLLIAAAGNADLVLGSRYVAGGRTEDWGLVRRAISRGGCLYAKHVLSVEPNDLTGGFKCFRREVLETIPLDDVGAAGYVFQVEMTYRALLAGFRVVEVPIVFRDRTAGASKMSRGIVLEAATHVPLLRWRLRQQRRSATAA